MKIKLGKTQEGAVAFYYAPSGALFKYSMMRGHVPSSIDEMRAAKALPPEIQGAVTRQMVGVLMDAVVVQRLHKPKA